MVDINTSVSPSKYFAGVPASTGFNPDWVEFSSVQHVTHAFRALEILRSGTISGRLVYDNSTLNRSRTHVIWLSPNHWSDGFRYGTVALEVELRALLQGRSAYWVEVAEYKTHACRILLAKERHTQLKPYDPTVKNGPWCYDESTGTHYYNSKYCLELMVEGDLPLAEISSTKFVDHHEKYCSEFRDSPHLCKDLGLDAQKAAAQFVAAVAASFPDVRQLKMDHANVGRAWARLQLALVKDVKGNVSASAVEARALAAAALWLYGSGRRSDAETLLGMFAGKYHVRDAIRTAVENAFHLPAGTLPNEED